MCTASVWKMWLQFFNFPFVLLRNYEMYTFGKKTCSNIETACSFTLALFFGSTMENEADIIIAQILFITGFLRSLACLLYSCSWNAFKFLIVSYGWSLQLQFFFVRPFIVASVFSMQKLPRLVPIVIKLMPACHSMTCSQYELSQKGVCVELRVIIKDIYAR